jgi:hypothetical protein
MPFPAPAVKPVTLISPSAPLTVALSPIQMPSALDVPPAPPVPVSVISPAPLEVTLTVSQS